MKIFYKENIIYNAFNTLIWLKLTVGDILPLNIWILNLKVTVPLSVTCQFENLKFY